MLSHVLTFLISAAVIWFFSGILVDSTSRLAKRFNRSGFAVAFLILGLLTSISEISVALNSMIGGSPQISAGNLSGASLVIFLLIIPFLAIFGNGVNLAHSLRKRDILLSLCVILLPTLFLADGTAGPREGSLMIAGYLILLWWIITQRGVEKTADELESAYFEKFRDGFFDLARVIVGGLLIFFGSSLLVDETIYFSHAFKIPGSFIGLLILSIGTNVPELVIAVRAVIRKRKEIAFGDYLGSASTNTLIMGAMTVGTGGFKVVRSEFLITLIMLTFGLTFFYFFSESGRKLTRKEGLVLGCIYIAFVVLQILLMPTLGPSAEG